MNVRKSGLILTVLTVSFLMAGALSSFADQVLLSFDPSPSPGVVGYKLYYGTQSARYDQVIDLGNSTQHELFDLKRETSYYFAATAYDEQNNESDFSPEIACRISASGVSVLGNPSLLSTVNASGDVSPLGNPEGKVDVSDALVCLRFALNLAVPTSEDAQRADVAPIINGQPNPDGRINTSDALVILRKALGLISF